jgi:hypothetical protein
MAASILNSPRAVQMSVYVVRAFVKLRLRQVLASHADLARRLQALERSVAALSADTRKQFDQVYEEIPGMMGSATRKQQLAKVLSQRARPSCCTPPVSVSSPIDR